LITHAKSPPTYVIELLDYLEANRDKADKLRSAE
jgi:hypothetical protein